MQAKYGKRYNNDKQIEDHHRQTFINNLRRINDHNRFKGVKYFMGINRYSDLTFHEFKVAHRILKNGHHRKKKDASLYQENDDWDNLRRRYSRAPFDNYPHTKSWHKEDKVAPIQRQGECNSCYAFAAISAVESLLAIKNNKHVIKYSEQEIIDCSREYGNLGCDGGRTAEAIRYVAMNGISEHDRYPYAGKETGHCNNEVPNKYRYKNDNMTVNMVINSEDEMVHRIAIQPVTADIGVNRRMMHYKNGTFDDSPTPFDGDDDDDGVDCPKEHVHAINIVGFTKDTFIVRNTWGDDWGEKGYMSMKRGSNLCGINDNVVYPDFG